MTLMLAPGQSLPGIEPGGMVSTSSAVFDDGNFDWDSAEKSDETPVVSTVHHPLGTHGLWHSKEHPRDQLPAYIQNVAHALIRSGHDKSHAIAIAVASMKRWAAGGGHVTPEVRAAAVKALAEWEALRAEHDTSKSVEPDVVKVGPKGYVHGWICVRPPCGTDIPKSVSAADLSVKKDGTVYHKQSGWGIGKITKRGDGMFNAEHSVDGKRRVPLRTRRDALNLIVGRHNRLMKSGMADDIPRDAKDAKDSTNRGVSDVAHDADHDASNAARDAASNAARDTGSAAHPSVRYANPDDHTALADAHSKLADDYNILADDHDDMASAHQQLADAGDDADGEAGTTGNADDAASAGDSGNTSMGNTDDAGNADSSPASGANDNVESPASGSGDPTDASAGSTGDGTGQSAASTGAAPDAAPAGASANGTGAHEQAQDAQLATLQHLQDANAAHRLYTDEQMTKMAARISDLEAELEKAGHADSKFNVALNLGTLAASIGLGFASGGSAAAVLPLLAAQLPSIGYNLATVRHHVKNYGSTTLTKAHLRAKSAINSWKSKITGLVGGMSTPQMAMAKSAGNVEWGNNADDAVRTAGMMIPFLMKGGLNRKEAESVAMECVMRAAEDMRDGMLPVPQGPGMSKQPWET